MSVLRYALLARMMALLCAMAAFSAPAEEIRIASVDITPVDDALVLDADFDLELTPRLEDALQQGIPLYFVIEFDLTRGRWYWFDQVVAHRTQKLRLWYHALTRQYRLSSGGALHQSFDSLSEAQHALSHVRNWTVAERAAVQPDVVYRASLRMRLDTTELPKPFQVSALANRDWKLASDWRRWRFSLLEATR